jgi:hypothetical protein
MNHTRISKILVLLFAVVLCFGPVGLAGPVGTAFTYQGRLIDANKTADGPYDFQFKLFDANTAGNKLGTDINKPGVDVIDGYFTAELDFGNVFDGDNRWLQIGVRPGALSDPNVYAVLSPRQAIAPTPYALYAKTAGSGGGDNLGNHTATQNVKLNGFWLSGDGGSEGVYVANDGNVGIGAIASAAKLEVAGNAKVSGTGNGVIFPDGTKQTTAAGNEIYFSVKRSADYNWPSNGAWLKVDFSSDSNVWSNVGGGFNAATSTFTAPIAGTYTFHGAIYFTNLTAGDMIYVQIAVGGKYYDGEYRKASGNFELIVSSITVHLNQGQTAQLYGYVSAASPPAQVYGNSSTSYAFTYLAGARVY